MMHWPEYIVVNIKASYCKQDQRRYRYGRPMVLGYLLFLSQMISVPVNKRNKAFKKGNPAAKSWQEYFGGDVSDLK